MIARQFSHSPQAPQQISQPAASPFGGVAESESETQLVSQVHTKRCVVPRWRRFGDQANPGAETVTDDLQDWIGSAGSRGAPGKVAGSASRSGCWTTDDLVGRNERGYETWVVAARTGREAGLDAGDAESFARLRGSGIGRRI